MDEFFTYPERPLSPPPAFFQRTATRLACAALVIVVTGTVGGLTDQGEDTPLESVAYTVLGLAVLVPAIGTVLWGLFFVFRRRRRWAQIACSYVYLGIVAALLLLGAILDV